MKYSLIFLLLNAIILQGCFPVKSLDTSEIVGNPIDICESIALPSPSQVIEVSKISATEESVCFNYDDFQNLLFNFQETAIYIKQLKAYTNNLKECYKLTGKYK